MSAPGRRLSGGGGHRGPGASCSVPSTRPLSSPAQHTSKLHYDRHADLLYDFGQRLVSLSRQVHQPSPRQTQAPARPAASEPLPPTETVPGAQCPGPMGEAAVPEPAVEGRLHDDDAAVGHTTTRHGRLHNEDAAVGLTTTRHGRLHDDDAAVGHTTTRHGRLHNEDAAVGLTTTRHGRLHDDDAAVGHTTTRHGQLHDEDAAVTPVVRRAVGGAFCPPDAPETTAPPGPSHSPTGAPTEAACGRSCPPQPTAAPAAAGQASREPPPIKAMHAGDGPGGGSWGGALQQHLAACESRHNEILRRLDALKLPQRGAAPVKVRSACGGAGRDALEGKGSQRRPQRRLGRRLEEVAKAVGGGYCRLQMPLTPGRQWLGIGWAPCFQCIPGGRDVHGERHLKAMPQASKGTEQVNHGASWRAPCVAHASHARFPGTVLSTLPD